MKTIFIILFGTLLSPLALGEGFHGITTIAPLILGAHPEQESPNVFSLGTVKEYEEFKERFENDDRALEDSPEDEFFRKNFRGYGIRTKLKVECRSEEVFEAQVNIPPSSVPLRKPMATRIIRFDSEISLSNSAQRFPDHQGNLDSQNVEFSFLPDTSQLAMPTLNMPSEEPGSRMDEMWQNWRMAYKSQETKDSGDRKPLFKTGTVPVNRFKRIRNPKDAWDTQNYGFLNTTVSCQNVGMDHAVGNPKDYINQLCRRVTLICR